MTSERRKVLVSQTQEEENHRAEPRVGTVTFLFDVFCSSAFLAYFQLSSIGVSPLLGVQ